ncbi:hypothetical protein A1O3_09601 [Capronia epimyces CBS 606.96]|uniref:C2H2-type domain-containing protein n=1 Tax=Capronia epimyces CBS 606.96 TaxID=1182542 RepID=W9XJ73_9EURO|nr:uncharacterized protein A1O3_09601 [Capronia epimyces CBS 606.96]EXJ77375.1 hypothetical protein A1O3_09601 [Capronia epimyces CBS 606.96]
MAKLQSSLGGTHEVELLTVDEAFPLLQPVKINPLPDDSDDWFKESAVVSKQEFYQQFPGPIDNFKDEEGSDTDVSLNGNIETRHRLPPPHISDRPPNRPPERSNRPDVKQHRLKWDLPVILQGTEVLACPDTGSEQNILSKDTASQLGILGQLDPSLSTKFVLGNGKGVQSLGALEMEIRFAQQPDILLTCMFHVFESLIRPAIIGGVFLRLTETMTKHRERRLRERHAASASPLQVMHIGTSRERFRCYVDSTLVNAHADTGSEMDLVSQKLVHKSSQRSRVLEHRLAVQFADASIGWISHQIFARFSADLQQPKTEWIGKLFYVPDELPCEILLGEETLDNLQAFDRESSFAMEILDPDGIELCTIFWAHHLERKTIQTFSRLWERTSNARARKRHADGDGECEDEHEFRLGFTDVCIEPPAQDSELSLRLDDPLLADVHPQFWVWLGQMASGGEVPATQSALPDYINMPLLHALDGWETHRRRKTDCKLEDSRELFSEGERRRLFDDCRDTVLNALQSTMLANSEPPSNPPATPPDPAEDMALGSATTPSSLRPTRPITALSVVDLSPTPGAVPEPARPGAGAYICTHEDCAAAPFPTQYLLNSHTDNMHSNARRPHFCPVGGCPRGPGGQGFKRKNELIRHGFMHLSPGYICPFCPDQLHKYPRPDNLQRHVRAHHSDQDRDDPRLCEALGLRVTRDGGA